jgi:hypothetical protein
VDVIYLNGIFRALSCRYSVGGWAFSSLIDFLASGKEHVSHVTPFDVCHGGSDNSLR